MKPIVVGGSFHSIIAQIIDFCAKTVILLYQNVSGHGQVVQDKYHENLHVINLMEELTLKVSHNTTPLLKRQKVHCLIRCFPVTNQQS